jgi:trans-aconitate 3-methyltransferase
LQPCGSSVEMADINNIFGNNDLAFWETYRKGRPQVPDGFFEMIFKYHEEHGGSFDFAHDVGAGPGIHSDRLATRFRHVRVSDLSANNIDMAKRRLGEPGGRYTFATAPIEDISQLAAGSVDLVHAGVMLHFADIPEAIEAVSHQLKPGGTFVATIFGHIVSVNNKEVESLMRKLYHRCFEEQREKAGPKELERMQHVLGIMAGGYDAVPLPTAVFEPGTLRLRLNYERPFESYDFYGPPFEPSESAVGEEDVVVNKHTEGWRYPTDLAGLRATLESIFVDFDDPVVKDLWSRLELVAGEQQLEVTWPSNVIMATKRREVVVNVRS